MATSKAPSQIWMSYAAGGLFMLAGLMYFLTAVIAKTANHSSNIAMGAMFVAIGALWLVIGRQRNDKRSQQQDTAHSDETSV